MPLPHAALFDLDGTLVDTAPDLADAVNDTLEELGMARRPEGYMRKWIGGGMERLVERALATSADGNEVDTDTHKRVVAGSLERYRTILARRSRPYPGTLALLQYLRAAKTQLACVTNKRTAFTGPLLTALGLAEYFEVVVCGDTVEHMKPHPAPLLHALKLLGVSPQEAVMIGDSTSDVVAARAADMQVVCVSYGYNADLDIHAADADTVVDSMNALRGWFTTAAGLPRRTRSGVSAGL